MTYENNEKDPVKIDITKEAVPPALLMKVKKIIFNLGMIRVV